MFACVWLLFSPLGFLHVPVLCLFSSAQHLLVSVVLLFPLGHSKSLRSLCDCGYAVASFAETVSFLDPDTRTVGVFVENPGTNTSALFPSSKLVEVQVETAILFEGPHALRSALSKHGISQLWLANHNELKSTSVLLRRVVPSTRLYAKRDIIPRKTLVLWAHRSVRLLCLFLIAFVCAAYVCPGCAEMFRSSDTLFKHTTEAKHEGKQDHPSVAV